MIILFNVKICYGNSHQKLIYYFYNALNNNTDFFLDEVEGSKALNIISKAYNL